MKTGPKPIPPEVRFWSKVNKAGPVPTYRPDLGCCWIWEWGRERTTGYGRFDASFVGTIYAHRIAYIVLAGPIPKGMTLDHLCRVRHCVNPDHLEVVTQRENTLRGLGIAVIQRADRFECRRGHPRNASGLGLWVCRECEEMNRAMEIAGQSA